MRYSCSVLQCVAVLAGDVQQCVARDEVQLQCIPLCLMCDDALRVMGYCCSVLQCLLLQCVAVPAGDVRQCVARDEVLLQCVAELAGSTFSDLRTWDRVLVCVCCVCVCCVCVCCVCVCCA